MELKAFPKVNIGLYVSDKRADGYHNIMSIFQKVYSVYDVVDVSVEKAGENKVSVTGLEQFVKQEDSTVYKIACLWLKEQKCTYSVRIKVTKNIPVGTGLGTPSSTAATALFGLESFAKEKMSREKLIELGAEVGSDIPFFLCDSDAAVVTSKGEVIKPISARKDLKIELIFNKKSKISTKEAYAKLDSRKEIKALPTETEMVEMYNRDISLWNFTNDFEIVNQKPELSGNFKQLMLTGSGSCWFTVS